MCKRFILGFRNQAMQCKNCRIIVHIDCIDSAKTKIACLNAKQSSSSIPINRLNQNTSSEHKFTVHTFLSPTYCSVCKSLITGVYKQGLRCSICKIAVHHSCRNAALSSLVCNFRQSPNNDYYHTLNGVRQSLNSAVKGFRRLNSSGDIDPKNVEISGPSNVKHISGTSKNRVLVTLEEAQNDPRHKNLVAETSSITANSECCDGENITSVSDSMNYLKTSTTFSRQREVVEVKDRNQTVSSSNNMEHDEPNSQKTRGDESNSHSYIQNYNEIKSSTKKNQEKLPPGWVALREEGSDRIYYFNQELYITQWERPS